MLGWGPKKRLRPRLMQRPGLLSKHIGRRFPGLLLRQLSNIFKLFYRIRCIIKCYFKMLCYATKECWATKWCWAAISRWAGRYSVGVLQDVSQRTWGSCGRTRQPWHNYWFWAKISTREIFDRLQRLGVRSRTDIILVIKLSWGNT